ncbi:MAG TPA: hypothetical protein VFJ16_19510, partial [Longimicrobium sp.]|nr:hypothetical protein [Longimicrobium sp.]
MSLRSRWLAAAATLLCVSAPLRAQVSGAIDTTPPVVVSISPPAAAQPADSVRLVVSWSDNVSLDPSTASVTVNGVEVHSAPSFAYSGSATAATSVGTVHLQSGANVVRARISDREGNVGAAVEV